MRQTANATPNCAPLASMTEAELSVALNKARESDTAEVEALREVAFNNLLREMGRSDAQVPLKPHQRVLGALA